MVNYVFFNLQIVYDLKRSVKALFESISRKLYFSAAVFDTIRGGESIQNSRFHGIFFHLKEVTQKWNFAAC